MSYQLALSSDELGSAACNKAFLTVGSSSMLRSGEFMEKPGAAVGSYGPCFFFKSGLPRVESRMSSKPAEARHRSSKRESLVAVEAEALCD